jgi:DNA-binding CsgD family transcriptional regulator
VKPTLLPYADPLATNRGANGVLDASLRTIFEDLSEGVLVLDGAGQRVYSNPALNDLVGANACLPFGTPEPPGYVPVDQRQRYLTALRGTSSLLTLDGSGTSSTWLELAGANGTRVRARVTISAFTGPRGWRFAVWLLNPERGPQIELRSTEPSGPHSPGQGGDASPDWGQLLAVESLTRREKDVLQLLLDGRRVSSIARSLYLSPQTVRNHLKAIFRKLGAHSQSELLDRLRPADDLAATRPRQYKPRAPMPAPVNGG